jgi:membrane associated rhomboid family serine protease
MADSEAGTPLTPLRSTANVELMDAWALVLASQGIDHLVERNPGDSGLTLWTAEADRERAAKALALADRDRHELASAELAPAPDQGPSAAGLAFVAVIAAFYLVTGPRDGADRGRWFHEGSAVAERILGGEAWRATTALTLHADPSHVAGNALAALIFVTAVGRWLGSGVALLLTLLTGVVGNLLVALVYGSHHNSVGASTATFGALGLLGGLQVVRWLRGGSGLGRRRRVLSIVAACLGVFAMLGVGERSDVLAHLFGLGTGLALGVAVGRGVRLPLPAVVRHGAGALAAGLLVACWWLAFRL